MTAQFTNGSRTLLVRVQNLVCALPLANIVETMRRLPIEPIAGVPLFVRGVSIVRGVPTPVVDLGLVLGTLGSVTGRFVSLRLGDRQVALAVDEVLGIRDLDASTIRGLPPLLQEASNDLLETIGTLDSQVLVVLRSGWELPESVWQALTLQEAIR
jgi:purine-binding chemotaxis protein CheW